MIFIAVSPPLAIPIPSPRRTSEKLLNRPVLNKVDTPQSPLYKNLQSTLESQGPPRSPLAKSLSSPPQSPLNTVTPEFPLGSQLVPLSLPPASRPTLELSSGAHREMAVDVPDAFVPMAKQAPRWALCLDRNPDEHMLTYSYTCIQFSSVSFRWMYLYTVHFRNYKSQQLKPRDRN